MAVMQLNVPKLEEISKSEWQAAKLTTVTKPGSVIVIVLNLSKLVIFCFFMHVLSCDDRTVVPGQDFKQFSDVCQTSANTNTPQFFVLSQSAVIFTA